MLFGVNTTLFESLYLNAQNLKMLKHYKHKNNSFNTSLNFFCIFNSVDLNIIINLRFTMVLHYLFLKKIWKKYKKKSQKCKHKNYGSLLNYEQTIEIIG